MKIINNWGIQDPAYLCKYLKSIWLQIMAERSITSRKLIFVLWSDTDEKLPMDLNIGANCISIFRSVRDFTLQYCMFIGTFFFFLGRFQLFVTPISELYNLNTKILLNCSLSLGVMWYCLCGRIYMPQRDQLQVMVTSFFYIFFKYVC